MRYRVFGEGYDVLLLHGWGADGRAVYPMTKYFKGARFIVPDMLSEEKNYPLTLKDYTCEVKRILDEAGAKDVIVVGHSFGGRVGIQLSIFFPERVKALILINSAGVMPRHGLKYKVKIMRYRRAKKRGKDLTKYGSPDYNALSDVMKKTFCNVVNEDLKKPMRKVRCKTLIISGTLDTETPVRSARIIHRRIRGSTLKVIDGATHFSYLDYPNTVGKTVRNFLEENKLCP